MGKKRSRKNTSESSNMEDQPTSIPIPSNMAIQLTSATFGLKFIKMVHTVARPVMYEVFCLGTKEPRGQQKFAGKQQMLNCPSGVEFTIPHLFKRIKHGNEGVARAHDDDAWHPKLHIDHTKLENCLYMIKEQWNEAMYKSLEMTEERFLGKVSQLHQVLTDTLAAAAQRYSHSMTTVQRNQRIQQINSYLDQIRDGDITDPVVQTSNKTSQHTSVTLTFGLRMIEILLTVARPVMHKVFCLGTPNKLPQQDFITFLKSLPSDSTANYLTATSDQRRFDETQNKQISNSPSGAEFHIPLILQCIKLGSEGVAGLDDLAWHTEGTQLENYLYMIKKQWNEAIYELLEMTQVDFLGKESNLHQLLVDTIIAAHQRYRNSTTTGQRDQDIQQLNERLYNIISCLSDRDKHACNMITQPTTMATQPPNMATQPTNMATQPTNMATQPTSPTFGRKREKKKKKMKKVVCPGNGTQLTSSLETTNMATQPTISLEPTNMASQPTSETSSLKVVKKSQRIKKVCNAFKNKVCCFGTRTHTATQSTSTLEPTNMATQSTSTLEHTNTATQSTSTLEHTNMATQSTSTLKHTNMATQSTSTLEHTNMATQSTSTLEHTSMTTQSANTLEPTNIATQSTSTLEHTNMATQSTSTLEHTSMTTQSANTLEPTNIATQSTSTLEHTNMATQSTSTLEHTNMATQSTSTLEHTNMATQSTSTLEHTNMATQSTSTLEPNMATQSTSTLEHTNMATQSTSTLEPTNMATQSTSTLEPTNMATQSTSMALGLKIIKMILIVATEIMYTIFRLGTKTKSSHVDFIEYLDNLPSDSTANYLKRKKAKSGSLEAKSMFNKNEKEKIGKSLSGKDFDITLLLKCIKLGSDNVADDDDSVWCNDGDQLENCLYIIKEQRNAAMHTAPEMTQAEFSCKESNLRQVLKKTLIEAQQRYSCSISVTQRDHLIQQMETDLDHIKDGDLTDKDVLTYYRDKLLLDLQNECRTELRKRYNVRKHFNPVSFILRSNLAMDVTLIFTDIEIEHEGKGSVRVVSYQDFLDEVQKVKVGGYKVVLLEGVAGSGKTTLITLLLQKWCDIKNSKDLDTIKDLDTYHLVLHVVCRDKSITSCEDLLRHSLPATFTKYIKEFPNLTKPLLAQCRILVLIDGLDEANSASRDLVKDVLLQLRAADATIICTSRPEQSLDLQNITGQSTTVTHTKIKGIPENKRVEFIEKNHKEIQQQTGSGRDTDQLVQLMKEKVKLEHFRLPLNLLLSAWVWDQVPGALDFTVTQTELYRHTHRLSNKKLNQRLTNHPDTSNMDQTTKSDKVNEWEPKLCQELLMALACDQLALTHEAEKHLRDSCATQGLPPKEMLGAYLSLEDTSQGDQHYTVPHKALQDYYGALYVVRTIIRQQQQEQASISCYRNLFRKYFRKKFSIMTVLEAVLGKGKVELTKFQNLLQHLVGLLHLDMYPMPDELVEEVVNLFNQSGVRQQEQWLDLLGEVKVSPAVLTAIAVYFPADDTIVVREGRAIAYSALLPHLSKTTVLVDISSDPTPLLPGLVHHTCTKADMWQHWYCPHPTPTPDPSLQDLLSRDDLEMYRGQGTVDLDRMSTNLTHLYLAVADDSQATTLLPLLHSLAHLEYLEVHIGAAVMPAAIPTTLPDLPYVNLYLSDVTGGEESQACDVADKLQPPAGYNKLMFPRSTLDNDGWRRVVEGLGQRQVKMLGLVLVPGDVTPDDLTLLKLTGTKLKTGFGREDFSKWERQ